MSEKTYSARELVLSLFPATDVALVPKPEPYYFEGAPDGPLRLLRDGFELMRLEPVAAAGRASAQLCCDLCQRSASRHYIQLFRAEVPGSGGRRYRYVSLCRDPQGCSVRRSGDAPVESLLDRVLRR